MLKFRTALALMLVATSGLATAPRAQQAGPNGATFDPATRIFSPKNPPLGSTATPDTAPTPTPEQQAEIDRQKQLQEIEQKREAAKKKAADARAAQKARQDAVKAADEKRMAAMKQAREERTTEMKKDHEELETLLQEQKDARKAYQAAKKSASSSTTGSSSTVDSDYRKAEADRQKKIQALRHPKFKSTLMSKGGNNTTGSSPATMSGNSTVTH